MYLIQLIFVALPATTLASGFLSESALRQLDKQAFQRELSKAMDMVLGCGGHISSDELESIERDIEPIWNSLHKISPGRIERRTLRYLVHRYFDRRSALHVRGFEPSRPLNSSGWGDVDILSQRVPSFVEAVLESRHKQLSGFDLRDAAYMIATVQQLVFESETDILEKAYKSQSRSTTQSLSLDVLVPVLESYMLRWMVGDDEDIINILQHNRSLLESSVPHWGQLLSMAEGRAKALVYAWQQDPRRAKVAKSSRPGHNGLSMQFSFEDAHQVVGGITTTFASFWESECQSMKTALVEMDVQGTGRVPLSKFYGSALDSEWRFGESEQYLRELGALDETNWRGKQVIIPNYIQGASNCIVSTSHYLVCCINECEALLGELEIAVGGPLASPGRIVELVSGLGFQTTLDDDLTRVLAPSLVTQLEQIAAAHEGNIPLHGRLFAQWLHYVFPRDCPFPHKAGTASAVTPAEFGDQYIAQNEDMRRHVEESNISEVLPAGAKDEVEWMSQWSPEEELVSEHMARRMRAPWERRGYVATCALVIVVLGLWSFRRGASKASRDDSLMHAFGKSHLV